MENKIYRRGFTLIELLVVVLIIGILAAVALPAYNKSVDKSRAAEVLASIRSLKDALEIYYMQNGVYPTTPDQLDIDIPSAKDFDITLDTSVTNIRAVKKTGYANSYHLRYFPIYAPSPYAGKLLCVAKDNDNYSKSICVALGGKNMRPYTHMAGGYTAYDLN